MAVKLHFSKVSAYFAGKLLTGRDVLTHFNDNKKSLPTKFCFRTKIIFEKFYNL